ncbi:hypothetical protein [Bacillus sp. FJAT-28004]|uniref:hypothetical protein n=1 Tax=Bacillus sp. FJAT-28004 TaxID=1679165 RepID=UPI000A52A0AD|nr:hypothetical protein [Bacillus sp. FJAT-28004]
MSKGCPTSIEVKLHAVQRCLAHKSNPNYKAKQLGVRKETNAKLESESDKSPKT